MGKLNLIKKTESPDQLPDKIPIDEGVWLQKVKVADLTNNDWNPNEMTKEMFGRLKDRIAKVGFRHLPIVQPNLVITDGEHRIKAARELGKEEIWVVVADEDELAAMIETADGNLIRGEFNPIKYGTFLNKLLTHHEPADLAELIPTPVQQIEALTQLVNDLPALRPDDPVQTPQQKWVVKFEFGNEQEYHEAEDGIKSIAKALNLTSNAATLLSLVRGFGK